jgi:hypothetical protein
MIKSDQITHCRHLNLLPKSFYSCEYQGRAPPNTRNAPLKPLRMWGERCGMTVISLPEMGGAMRRPSWLFVSLGAAGRMCPWKKHFAWRLFSIQKSQTTPTLVKGIFNSNRDRTPWWPTRNEPVWTKRKWSEGAWRLTTNGKFPEMTFFCHRALGNITEYYQVTR